MLAVNVGKVVKKGAPFLTTLPTLTANMKRPQHITITSIKYLISYPINMKVSNQVFTTSNSNKCVGGLSCLYVLYSVVNAVKG